MRVWPGKLATLCSGETVAHAIHKALSESSLFDSQLTSLSKLLWAMSDVAFHPTATEVELITSNSPVPARPAPIAVGALATWNLESVNKAANPQGFHADQLLDAGASCTYDIILRVWDLMRLSSANSTTWTFRTYYKIDIYALWLLARHFSVPVSIITQDVE